MSLNCSCRVVACCPDDAELLAFGYQVSARFERSACSIHGREEGHLVNDNDLCELVGRLKHADYELRKAVKEATRLKGYDSAGGGPGCSEMADLAGRIEAVRVALAKLPVVGILEAIKPVSDARSDFYTHERKCGRCERPFDLGETAYEPGRYDAWTWPRLPVCWACFKILEESNPRGT
jgi:hypothetical protein